MIELNSHKPVPPFRLPSSRGVDISLDDYRHRQPVVLFFMHGAECPSCRERLCAFAVSYDDYCDWQTEVLAILPGPPHMAAQLAESLALPFPVMSDAGGDVRAQFIGTEGVAVFVLDRFNAPETGQAAAEADALMTPDEALDWVRFGALACPECGVSEWRLD